MFCRDREESLELCLNKYNYVVTYMLPMSDLFIIYTWPTCVHAYYEQQQKT